MSTLDVGRTKPISILISIQTKQKSVSVLIVVRNNKIELLSHFKNLTDLLLLIAILFYKPQLEMYDRLSSFKSINFKFL